MQSTDLAYKRFERWRRLMGPEALESRALLTADIHITSAYLVDGNNSYIAAPPVGEAVFARVDWMTSGAPSGVPYVVRYTMDGVPLDSGTLTGQPGNNLTWLWYRGGWLASPGSHTIQITVDPDNALGDTTPADNTTSFSFSPVAPSTLADKFIWPLAGTQSRDWTVYNYVDADPRVGPNIDFNGGPFIYDGHDALDISAPNFAKMDAGLPVMAAAPGVVAQVADGYFDRNTFWAGQPANFVVIDHPNGWRTYYYHFSANTITVKVGDVVPAGRVLGLTGSSGNSSGAHLHFAVYHNWHVVETYYDPAAYWQQTTPYQGSVTSAVMDGGIAVYNATADLNAEERPVSITTIPTSYVGDVTAWLNPANVQVLDTVTVNWIRPDNVVSSTNSFVVPAIDRGGYYYWTYNGPWGSNPGTWAFQLLRNGTEIFRKNFLVTAGAQMAALRVTESGIYLPNGRTTPLDFGTTPTLSPVQKTIALSNVGFATLALNSIVLPPGFSLVGALPPLIGAGASANITVQMDAAAPDSQFGQIKISTNDPSALTYSFNVKGVVSGAPPSGAPLIFNTGPAALFNTLGPAVALNPQAMLSDSDSANYGSGSLTVEFASAGAVTDQLGIINQGTGAGQIGVSGANVTYGGVTIGTFSGGSISQPLVVQFNTSATLAAVQTLLDNLSFANGSISPGSAARYLRLKLIDDQGNTSNQAIRTVVTDAFSTSVVGRKLFYNQSGTGGATVRYDGNNLAINSLDDNAVATDKVAYLPEDPGAATFANVSSYSKGINGIMVDIAGPHPNISADDFEFRVGNNNSPTTWALANAPTSISVRAGAGVSGADRVEIIWNSGAPTKQWLEVIVLANPDTGLPPKAGYPAGQGDVFFFGNAMGDTGAGDTAVNATVNAVDEGGARNNPQVVGNNIPITNIYDVNRNAVVNAVDEGIIRNNNTNSATVVKYLNLASPPAAPEGGGGGGSDGGDAGIASALTASAPTSSEARIPRWLGLRLDEVDLNSDRVAEVFQRLHDFNTPTARKLLVRADRMADALGLDHELLDWLLADLGLE